MKKAITLCLLAALMLPTVACGDEAASVETDAPQNTPTTESVAHEITPYEDELPELDFNGEIVHMFATAYYFEDSFVYTYMTTDEQNGDVVNDAIYNRNRAVEERLNIEFDWYKYFFLYEERSQLYATLTAGVMANDDSNDITILPIFCAASPVMNGIFTDISTLPYVDMTKGYWYQGFNDLTAIDGKNYIAAGDAVLPYVAAFFCIPFNKEMAETNDIENLYELVFDGKWTYDVLYNTVKDLYQDLNGNGETDIDDQYGLELPYFHCVDGFTISMDGGAFEKDGSNYKYVYGSERNIDIYNRVFKLLHESGNGTFLSNENSNELRLKAPFAKGNALFTLSQLHELSYYRDLDFSYGILPYPKYDETQENYLTYPGNGGGALLVPVTNAESETIGAVLEALNSEGYRTTTPAFFEIALKVKYSEDDDNAKVFDILRETERMHIDKAFSDAIGDLQNNYVNMVCNKSNSGKWASKAESMRKTAEKNIEKMLSAIRGE